MSDDDPFSNDGDGSTGGIPVSPNDTFEFAGHMLPQPQGPLPLSWIWGISKRSQENRMNVLGKVIEHGLQRPLTRTEAYDVSQYVGNVVLQTSFDAVLGGLAGAGLSLRKARKQGWTFAMLRPGVPTTLPYVNRMQFLGFPSRFMGPKAEIIFRATVATLIWGRIFPVIFGPMSLGVALTQAEDPKRLSVLLKAFNEGMTKARDERIREFQEHRGVRDGALVDEASNKESSISESEQTASDASMNARDRTQAWEFNRSQNGGSRNLQTNSWEKTRSRSNSSSAQQDSNSDGGRTSSWSDNPSTSGTSTSSRTEEDDSPISFFEEDTKPKPQSRRYPEQNKSNSGSKWDQIRSEASRDDTADSYGAEGPDQDRERAQREFDARVERERKGKNF
jgi:hypothetical protein